MKKYRERIFDCDFLLFFLVKNLAKRWIFLVAEPQLSKILKICKKLDSCLNI